MHTSGFIYIWYDRKHKRYYIGSHWGSETDTYICSSPWMNKAYKIRPYDFKRRIISRISSSRKDLLTEENRWLKMIKSEELKVRYYNVHNREFGHWSTDEERRDVIAQKISASRKGKPCSPRDRETASRNISEAKKAAFAKRLAETGSKVTDEHRRKNSEARIGKKHSEEWKVNNSLKIKESWARGDRDHLRKEKTDPIPRGAKMKELWADPVWKAAQQAKLKEGSARRHAAK